ncbi:MAG: tetratricopeptide repeat protein [Anaerolineales bacterium]|jgi:tetratricopeptide (TPR) repeat protein
MYKDADIINELVDTLGAEAAQTSTERLLRVPQAWEALREPEFLRAAIEASGGQPLFPSLVAALSMGAHELSDITPKDSDAIEAPDSTNLQAIAKQAVELCRLEQESGPQVLIDFMLGAASNWESAFICAWSQFQDRTAILETIAKGYQPAIGNLVANSLLAYMSAQQAAQELLGIDTDLAFKFLPWTQDEPELYDLLQEDLIQLSGLFHFDPESRAEHLPDDALILSELGKIEDAHAAIRRAWDLTTQQTALVADRLAMIARNSDDLVLEAEARQQALDAYPTAQRRSAAALSSLQLDRYEDGLNLVREGNTFEENIAAGLIYLAIQDTHNAGKRLNKAAQQCADILPVTTEWFLHLAEGLEELGFQVQAIRVYQQLIARFPTHAPLRSAISALLFAIGDYEAAIQQAHVCVTLNPGDTDTRELLAKAYENVARPEAALKHWETIAEKDVEKNIQLGRCALNAGEPEVAKRAADSLLEVDSENLDALVLVGRTHSQTGNHSDAKTILKDVTERSPEEADAWIALAMSLQATNEMDLAGETLQEGLRANPGNPDLHMARAAWLKSIGRNAEALDHTRAAVRDKPENTQWLIEHADLLLHLGYHEQARENLETVIASEPANWRATEMLAQTYEKLGEFDEALAIIEDAPAELPAESNYYIGRLLASAAESSTDLDESIRRLAHAKSAGITDPSLEYWMGVSHRRQKQHQPAAKHYLRYLEAVKDAEADHYLDAVVGFADSALEIGEITLALTQLEKAKPSFPTSIKLLSTLSEAQFMAGKRSKSLEVAREALELFPDSEEALKVFKRAAERSGELDEAIEAQRRITSKTPEDPGNWLDMARIDDRRGEAAASRAALAKAITLGRMQPGILNEAADCAESLGVSSLEIRLRKQAASLDEENDTYLEKLAIAADRVGDLETATEAWLECAGRQPKSAPVLIPAAKSLWKLNRRTAALGLLQQAAAVAPENPDAHFELGQALIKMNELDRGLNEITKAVSLNPENSVLRAQASSLIARYSRPDEGLSILNGSPTAGKFPDVAEARAECHWLNGDPEQAGNVLDTIPPAVSLSVKGMALKALTNLAAGEVQAAHDEYKQIQTDQIQSSTDLEWALTAGIALGHSERLSEFHDVLIQSERQDPESIAILLQAFVEAENLGWISSNFAHASLWQNKLEISGEMGDELLSIIEKSSLPSITVDMAKQMQDMSMGRVSADGVELPRRVSVFNDAVIQQCQALALLRANRPSKAIQQLDELPGDPYNRSVAALIRGLAQSSAGQFTGADRSFVTAGEFSSLKPLARYCEAQMWHKSGADEKAITTLNDAISLQPDEAEWHMQLAGLYQDNEQNEAALAHLQQAVELEPDDHRMLVTLARAYRCDGQLDDAEDMYARSLQTNPASPKVWKEAGEVAFARGDNERAEAWFEKACSLLPGDAGCIIGSALSAQQLGNSKKALERAREAYTLAPDDPLVLSGLGDILAANGSLDKAIQIYDRAMRVSEQNKDIRLARSKLLLRAQRPEESIADLEQLVDTDPDYHEAWQALARAYADRKEYGQALQAAQQAVSISPRSIDYRLLMAKLCRQSGQLDQALGILTELEHEAPGRVEIAREKGTVHEERRELELAVDAYNRALAIDSHDAQTVVKAGLLMKQLKAYEESAELLERGTQLLPNDADLHQQLAAVRALQFVHGNRIDEQVVAS